jgi:D-lactate dehydrogenase
MLLRDWLPPDQVHTRWIDRLAYARDASIYRLVPEAVVRPRSEENIQQLFKYARKMGKAITFRTGGTSLSGQAVTEGIIAETIQGWQDYEIIAAGAAIRLQPGIIGDHANRLLAPYQRRIGPDPASITAARIGGIISNNASGMVCGVRNNAYHTLRHIRFILPNGHVYDTSRQADYDRFLRREARLSDGLRELKKTIRNQESLVAKIRYKYRIKNTLGYALNALLDFEHPLDIFAHLLVGAEGTLAFISAVTLNTIPDPPFKATGLLLFDTIDAACEYIPQLKESGADAVELMDYASLTTARYLKDPPYDPGTLPERTAALLCEFQRHSEDEVKASTDSITRYSSAGKFQIPGGFQTDEVSRLKLWRIRKGLYPTVGSLRRIGTSVITEDICYDVENLAAVVTELENLFRKWEFKDAVIFGHAKDGNLHFVTSIDLESRAGIKCYDGLIQDLVELTTAKYQGSLKAEHGTGRNMAPFLEQEWGEELTAVMWRIKELADPDGILNPGVLLNRDPELHIKSLKPLPKVDETVDLCVECGFCEATCPSRDLTLTPRRRIAVARELRLLEANRDFRAKEVRNDFRYDGLITCAVDGLCELACPVNINTGVYVKGQRHVTQSPSSRWVAQWTVDHFDWVQSMVRGGLSILHLKSLLIGGRTLYWFSHQLNRLSRQSIPVWNLHLPKKAPRLLPVTSADKAAYLYYPSCLTRVFAANKTGESLLTVITEIARRTGTELHIPAAVNRTCCGTPYSSKGYRSANLTMLSKTVELLFQESQQGRLPIVVDTSPCTYQLLHAGESLSGEIRSKWEQLTFLDLVPFLSRLIQNHPNPPLDRTVILHPTCATEKMNERATLLSLARTCAKEVILPSGWGCCGFAGDRGLLVPELTAAATRPETEHLADLPPEVIGYSNSRMCEVGMSAATGRNYESIALLVRDYLDQT